MQRICKASGQPFEITPDDLEFYKKVSPKIGGKVFEIPPPMLCPDERQRRRLALQNMTRLFSRICSATGKSILSHHSEASNIRVYDNPYWYSDAWNPKGYGREFDFSRPFFDQFKDLLYAIPHRALHTRHDQENSDYTNYANFNKNCYLIFESSTNQDCMYGMGLKKSSNCIDNLQVFFSELTYECVDCRNCYDLKFSKDCESCNSSFFLRDCISCRNCFSCINLRHKEFCIFNKQASETEYRKFMEDFSSGSFSAVQKYWQEAEEFFRDQIHRAAQGYQNENSTGDNLYECRNVHECFDVQESEDMKFCQRVYLGPNSDCYDVNKFGNRIRLVYEGGCVGLNCDSVLFSFEVTEQSSNILYSYEILTSEHLFGCVGLRRSKYCILNKQYSKAEYESLAPKIIEHMRKTGEWGEYFPMESSPFAYNETMAHEYFPLTKEEVLTKGWKWRDETNEIPQVEKIIPANLLPDSIHDTPDDILNWAIECEESKKPFIIQKSELEFYRKMSLPIPHFHPDIRHAHRMAKRNPRKLWDRNCDNCGKPIETSYAPKRPEKVYCEECYQKAVY